MLVNSGIGQITKGENTMLTWQKWILAGNKSDGTELHYGEGTALSTDTLPTTGIANGSTVLLMNTSKVKAFDYDNAEWINL